MIKNKIHPRALPPRIDLSTHGFWYRLISSQRFIAIIGLGFLVLIIFPLAKTYSQRRMVEKEITDVQNQIVDFEKQNQQLKDLIVYLQSDQSLEEQARLNLNLKKPGEGVIMVEDKKINTDDAAAPAASSTGSNLSKWWNYFFK